MKLWKKLKNGRLSEKDNLASTFHWSNPPRTRPRKAKTQITLALFRPFAISPLHFFVVPILCK